MLSTNIKRGFTLIEVLVGTAIFLVVSIASYNAFVGLIQLATANQANLLAVELADEQMEIIRNMPYTQVGLSNGIPQGVLPQTQSLTRGSFAFTVNLTVRNINLSTSTVQASSKLVEIDITCPTCQNHFNTLSLTGQISPANLQSAAKGGALVVKAFDANGQPVQGASVSIQSVATSSVQDSDVTDNSGILNVIGVPPGGNMYRITVTKSGYSTDRTYPVGGAAGPTPSKPDANVLDKQVTTISFAIDKLSSMHFDSVSPTCGIVPSYHFSLKGSKTIATSPSPILKYPSTSLSTGVGGTLNLSNMEWDTYSLTPTDNSYDLAGITPFSPFALNPGNAQEVQLITVPKVSGNSLLVAVEDSSTRLPLSGASVQLSGGYFNTTGQGYFSQTDWTHGAVQDGSYIDPKAYANGSGIDTMTSSSSGSVALHWSASGNPYSTIATGTLESSTFDTGTTSNFYSLNWTPLNQPLLAGTYPVKFQFATAPSSTPSGTWNYLGPDGTQYTYYTVSGSPVSSVNSSGEYARYMMYLSTQTATVTPSVNDVSFTYTSSCTPPGQVLFQGLSSGTYALTVSKPGYVTTNNQVTIGSGWQSWTILMNSQ